VKKNILKNPPGILVKFLILIPLLCYREKTARTSAKREQKRTRTDITDIPSTKFQKQK
jgi:hypothetical protein